MSPPVFRFAPSPNGRLHLGHAGSALLNQRLAAEVGGRLLLRIEDIDVTRCRPEFERAIHDDCTWLGLQWEQPVWRQSERFHCYGAALDRLAQGDLLYPCFCTRKQISADSAHSGTDPDGAPLYSGRCRSMPAPERHRRLQDGGPFALRLHMDKALEITPGGLTWREGWDSPQEVEADPAAWGDAVLRRKEFPASYHIAVVVDDAAQGVTHVVRGRDLYHATSLHRLLQSLLELPAPAYIHHALITDQDGEKLAKSRASQSIADLRAAGLTAHDVRSRAAL
jgi:glutamyl-Q tRNA(Asp) synthetase